MINFNRVWVTRQMNGMWEELAGLRPWMPARFLGHPTPNLVNQAVDLTYAQKWIPFSDLKAARLIQLQMDNRLTFAGDESRGDWYFWNDVFHEQEESGIVGDWVAEAFADQVVEAMNQVEPAIEADIQAQIANGATESTVRRDAAAKWKGHRAYQEKLHSDAGLNALKSRLRKQCTKPPSYFDDDRRWLVCEDGVIDLDGFRKYPVISNNFHAHHPNRPVTRAVGCKFNPKATAPTWDHFLETSIPDPEIRAFLQRLVGAAFLAESKVKAIPNLQGPKDCGKTIFVSTLEKLAGGYGIQPSPDALMTSASGGTNFEQDTLRGARFVGISEPSVTKKLDDTFCKQVTGGDEVRTRTLNQKSRPWLPQCVIFIASNQAVNFNTQDSAFTERVCLVQFPHQFFDAKEAVPGEIHIKDYEIEEKLAAESEGIFLWCIMGMRMYLDSGISKPESVKAAGRELTTEASSALTWVREQREAGRLEVMDSVGDAPGNHYALTSNLYKVYQMDVSMAGERPLPKIRFKRHLEHEFGDEVNSGGRRIPRLIGRGSFANFSVNSDAAPSADLNL